MADAASRQFLNDSSGEPGIVNIRGVLTQSCVQPIFLEVFSHFQVGPHAANARLSFSLPLNTFVFTVPRGISKTRAASSWESPFWQQSNTAVRSWSGRTWSARARS